MASSTGRVDVHFHALPPAYRTALTTDLPRGSARSPAWTPDLAIEMMDRNKIASAILSISVPGVHFGDNSKACTLCRTCNEYFGELRDSLPLRFGAFAALPLPDVNGACAEIDYALNVLKLDGVGLFSNYGGKHLGDAEFDPVLERLNEYGAVAFIHPSANCLCQGVQPNVPLSLIEYLFDTTRAALNLVLSGAMDRFPRVRFILAHAGGTLPYTAWRVADTVWRQLSQSPVKERYPLPLINHNIDRLSADVVLSRLRQFWYDTALSAAPQTFASLMTVAEPTRILFGSDWPYSNEPMVQDSITNLEEPQFLSTSQLAAINRDNALQLFPRLR